MSRSGHHSTRASRASRMVEAAGVVLRWGTENKELPAIAIGSKLEKLSKRRVYTRITHAGSNRRPEVMFLATEQKVTAFTHQRRVPSVLTQTQAPGTASVPNSRMREGLKWRQPRARLQPFVQTGSTARTTSNAEFLETADDSASTSPVVGSLTSSWHSLPRRAVCRREPALLEVPSQ
jgi:hypothetical protein